MPSLSKKQDIHTMLTIGTSKEIESMGQVKTKQNDKVEDNSQEFHERVYSKIVN